MLINVRKSCYDFIQATLSTVLQAVVQKRWSPTATTLNDLAKIINIVENLFWIIVRRSG